MQMQFPHASYSYDNTDFKLYLISTFDILFAKVFKSTNITYHLPVELVLKSKINIQKGNKYVDYVQKVADLLNVVVVWENIALLETKGWSLKEKMIWDHIPSNIDLCLDTGHLILGEKNPQKRILEISKKYKNRIKHLHIHENDLIHDQHLVPNEIVNKKIFNIITKGRTWIIEP